VRGLREQCAQGLSPSTASDLWAGFYLDYVSFLAPFCRKISTLLSLSRGFKTLRDQYAENEIQPEELHKIKNLGEGLFGTQTQRNRLASVCLGHANCSATPNTVPKHQRM
jgi:hypothetical protein